MNKLLPKSVQAQFSRIPRNRYALKHRRTVFINLIMQFELAMWFEFLVLNRGFITDIHDFTWILNCNILSTEERMYYRGNDMYAATETSATECAQKCDDNTDCLGFVYLNHEIFPLNSPFNFYLKSQKCTSWIIHLLQGLDRNR